MKIVLEARSLSRRGSGTKTYVYQLIRHLLTQSDSDVISLLYDTRDGAEALPGAHGTVVPCPHELLMPWWLQFQVPRALQQLRPDVVHFTKADVPRHKVAPTVVTIFDTIPLLFPQSQSFARRWYWPGALQRAATLSDHIVTISESAKRDIMKRFNRPAEKITVTSPAVDMQHFRPMSSEPPTDTPYILFVGTRDQRKNVGGLLRAFASIADQVPHHVIVAGGPALRPDTAEAEASRLNLRDRVVFRDFVPYEDLPTLYSNADLFVWPSIYEGWGFPPQEAMACGTPVVVSDGGAIPEVVGEAGSVIPFSTSALADRVVDDDFESRLATEMGAILGDASRQAAMRKAGLARVQHFSWATVARATRAVYHAVAQA